MGGFYVVLTHNIHPYKGVRGILSLLSRDVEDEIVTFV